MRQGSNAYKGSPVLEVYIHAELAEADRTGDYEPRPWEPRPQSTKATPFYPGHITALTTGVHSLHFHILSTLTS